mgnify:CR=1 FL=1
MRWPHENALSPHPTWTDDRAGQGIERQELLKVLLEGCCTLTARCRKLPPNFLQQCQIGTRVLANEFPSWNPA